MFQTVLIANRGAIACRIIRTLHRLGVQAVAVFSDADIGSNHVAQADAAIRIGPASAAESYLDGEALLAAARQAGADALHPGYGFLSENADFAERCEAAGITFIGPTPGNIRAFGFKHTARALAQAQGVPLAPGTDLLTSVDEALVAAQALGFPVMLKATAGGGGIGMRICTDQAALAAGFATVARLGAGHFGDDGVFVERYVENARHIEVQVFGDGQGRVVALGERDCSLQRRNQKVVEETPAPHLPAATRQAMVHAAVRLTAAAAYRSAGTVEYLYDPARDVFFFLEVNTRLQVEHGVTEQVTGVDLVEWMVRLAAGETDVLDRWDGTCRGASVQVRLYAEDPAQDYRPSAGTLTDVAFPEGVRVDGWVATGTEVSAFYDPLLAKMIVTAPDRAQATQAMARALDATRLAGIETNLDWLRTVVRSPAFVSGAVSTRTLADIVYTPRAMRVLAAGAATSLQDYPGRIGYWSVGVPPSGPMDAFSFRLGNRLLGNPEGAAGLEFTVEGPTLRVEAATRLCLTGASFDVRLDGRPVPWWDPFSVVPGQTLTIGRLRGAGLRGYLLVAGGFEAPPYLGSRSAFTLGGFGGHAGRGLVAGDTLHPRSAEPRAEPLTSFPATRPVIGSPWSIRVLSGPHGAPDFFTPADIAMIGVAEWTVHYNSNRTGVRLSGPKPAWARRDGGEAGLHPSNIHDNAYAIGAIDFTGDMPIILGPDGPSLGGFVCPFVVIAADLWKLGQLAPGDRLRFAVVDDAAARAADVAQTAIIAGGPGPGPLAEPPAPLRGEAPSPILAVIEAAGQRPRVTYRRQGDRHLLIEYGPIVLDLELRLRAHALMLAIDALALAGIIDVTPGIRSLQVHYDALRLGQAALLEVLQKLEQDLGTLDGFEVPSRIVHLPLSWDDAAIAETIEKYTQSVRDDAPWCPDNIDFIRRINGLDHRDDVRRVVFEANYLVMGLGDVYLGAPVATPIDPRHRLVTTKYNPARTWTPPNVVGIGGAYLCIYGMEGPGGYQLFGRTLQVWNTYRQTAAFTDGKPWLLRFFDQIKFFPVSSEALAGWRRDFPLGRREIRIEPTVFRLADYRAFLAEHRGPIEAFQRMRQAAFEDERAAWERQGEFRRIERLAETADVAAAPGADLLAGFDIVRAPLSGSVWRIDVAVGDPVAAGAVVAVIEAMKMECPVTSPGAGIVRRRLVEERASVAAGTALLAIEPTPDVTEDAA